MTIQQGDTRLLTSNGATPPDDRVDDLHSLAGGETGERKRLHDLFMQAPAMIAILRGPQHLFELANPLYMQAVGAGREIIGKSVREALPEIRGQGVLELLDAVYRTGEPYFGDETPVHLDRKGTGHLEEAFFNFVYLPDKDAAGETQGILVHAVDVTDQVRARRRLEEQNRILEMITQGVSLADALDFLVRSIERQSANGMKGSLLLLDRDGKHLRHGAAPCLPAAYNAAIDGIAIGPNAGSCGTAAYTKAPVIVADIASDPLWADFRDLASEHDLRSCWSTPIFSATGDLLGTFAMYYNEPRSPSEADRNLIVFATRTAALLIERTRAEEAMRESERRFRAMIDALPAAIYTTDAEGRLTHFNPAAVAFSGRVPELGTDQWCVTWKLSYPDGTPMPHDECPMAIALKEGRIIAGAEAIAERPDGTRVWFTPFPTPLRDAAGRIVGGINMLVDITERKQAEEARARLAAIVESSDDAIVSKDLSGIIQTWNKGAERIFGYTPEDAVGQPITMIIPPDRLDEEPEILRRIRCGERVDHFETVRRHKDGTLLDISLTISPVVDSRGAIVGASKVARDITERRALERQKDQFLGIAAHELRTPVTGIKGYTQLLARRLHRAGDTASAEMLGKLDRQIDRLTGLIDDLLDVARIESGVLPFRPAPFELNAFVRETVEEMQQTTERHTIAWELAESVTLVADRDRIGQVLTNLLGNAIKYSPQADRVVVRTTRDGENVIVSVQDFGIGIPREKQAHLFERFYRVDGESRAGFSGLGLGLYVAAEFVKRHGAAIWVESEEGEGTTVRFSLPLNGLHGDKEHEVEGAA
jgi:PAS domain S-box-containing protein